MTAEDLDLLREEITKARNLAANMELLTEDDAGLAGNQPNDAPGRGTSPDNLDDDEPTKDPT